MAFKISKILVPVDFSDGSRAAVKEARSLAKLFHASIEIFHVWPPPPLVPLDLQVLRADETNTTLGAEIHKEAQAELDAFLRSLEDAGGAAAVTSNVEFGDPSKAICDHAIGFDLIVMGTHGRRGLSRFVVGSVTEAVVRKSRIPVLTVHSADPLKASPRLLVPIDFTPASKAAAEYANWFASRTGGEVTLLHAWDMPLFAGPKLLIYGQDSRESLEEWIRRNRHHRLEQARAEDGDGTKTILVRGDAPAMITEAAANGFDLVVMGTRGRAFGSVASHVVRQSACPVLVFPEAQ